MFNFMYDNDNDLVYYSESIVVVLHLFRRIAWHDENLDIIWPTVDWWVME